MLARFRQWIALRRSAEAHLARGRLAEARGQLREACGHYRSAVAADPRYASTHLHLGVALEAAGDLAGAIAAYGAALAAEPANAHAAYNLGKALFLRGDLPGAVAMIRSALAAHPEFPEAQVVLASALEAQGDVAGAIASLQAALGLRPDFGGALFNLGMLHFKAQRWTQAVEALSRAVQAEPANPDASCWLGNALVELGRHDEARTHLERALSLAPRIANAHFGLGNLHAAQQRFAEAADCYRRALAIDPRHAQAHVSLANALVYLAEPEEARTSCDRALAIDPEFAAAQWLRAMCRVPAVRDAGADLRDLREKFAADLRQLDNWFDERRLEDGHRAVGVQQPFWLAYQAEDNLRLLSAYGGLCARLMGAWQERAGLRPRGGGRSPGPMRIGVVSQYFRRHSVWEAIVKGWFQQLDPRRFELQAFCLGAARDEETRFAESRAARFVRGPLSLRQWAEAILEARPDAILYPEIGMDPMTVKLASLRLAPLQAASWGHPETSGLPTVDAFLSAQGLEPASAQAHYAERLIALPNLGCHVAPPASAPYPRVESGRAPLLICPGTPFKYAPEHDRIYAQIARRLARCQLVFFTYRTAALSAKLHRRLSRAFADHGLRFEEHARVVPWMPSAEFHALLSSADVLLDTVGFSGFNTALQAVACGLPVVTLEGRFLRGRLASGILRRIGLDELVAGDEAQYIELAVRIAREAGYRADLRQRMQSARHALYADTAPIRALEDFLERGAGA